MLYRSPTTRHLISKRVALCNKECMYRKQLSGNNYTTPYTYCYGPCTEETFKRQWIDLRNSKTKIELQLVSETPLIIFYLKYYYVRHLERLPVLDRAVCTPVIRLVLYGLLFVYLLPRIQITRILANFFCQGPSMQCYSSCCIRLSMPPLS